ncbi:MAG: EutN/CcmL family microcompartment protein [bacterium]
MTLARVVGSVVASSCEDRVEHPTYLLVQAADRTGAGKKGAAPLVALDVVGAGPGELVVLAQGSSSRQTARTDKTAVDAVVVAIVDAVNAEGRTTYRK